MSRVAEIIRIESKERDTGRFERDAHHVHEANEQLHDADVGDLLPARLLEPTEPPDAEPEEIYIGRPG